MKTIIKRLLIVILALMTWVEPKCSIAEAKTEKSVSGVSKISGISDDIFRGVDISSAYALEKSGVQFKYSNGEKGNLFDILSGAGCNYIRLRIWNNPYDSAYPYKGYGGGNCNLYTAKMLGKRATEKGMKVFIDFHYSDFWTDPAKHYPPKEWADYDLKNKKDAIYNYTYYALNELISYGVDVEMVQVGNETNGSLCGIGGFNDGVWDLSSGVADLMKEGCYAIDDINTKYNKGILKVLHFTRLVNDGEWYAEQLEKQHVHYDVFATSFYPMWDGTVSDMTRVLTNIAKKYNKKVMIAETAYPYTFNDSDGSINSIYGSSAMKYSDYAVNREGQSEALAAVFNGIEKVNKKYPGYGLGVFYWEPAWIGTDKDKWGVFGTGWASSVSEKYERLFNATSTEYATTDQGSSWDNMTLFDQDGKASGSLYVFNDILGK